MAAMDTKYDLVVIGGGPGGYPGAIRASQLGLRVALIEAERLGGECTNYGCIPTKALLRPANMVWSIRSMKFIKGELDLDFGEYVSWVSSIVERISGGVEMLLKGYGVDLYRGRARLVDRGTVYVENMGEVRADKILLAVGTSPSELPSLGVDGEVIHNNRTILGVRRKPSSILIVGGGYIGVELASLYAKIGVEVHLVEIMPGLLPGMDQDLSRAAERMLKNLGVRIRTNTTVKSVNKKQHEADVELSSGEKLSVEKILVAVGRKPRIENLGLEKAGVELDNKGYIRVSRGMETSVGGVYASGDAAGPPLLAHKAFMQSVVAAENIAGKKAVYDPRAVPSVIYTEPEMAFVGMSEEEARKSGYNPKSVKMPLGGVARAIIEGGEDGFVKIIYDEDTKQLLGFVAMAPHASEIVSEASLAIEMGASIEDLSLTIHPHPTISEILGEVSELALGRPKHFLIRRRK